MPPTIDAFSIIFRFLSFSNGLWFDMESISLLSHHQINGRRKQGKWRRKANFNWPDNVTATTALLNTVTVCWISGPRSFRNLIFFLLAFHWGIHCPHRWIISKTSFDFSSELTFIYSNHHHHQLVINNSLCHTPKLWLCVFILFDIWFATQTRKSARVYYATSR